jgi:steroid delta-isomerase-like uncharacterized protein
MDSEIIALATSYSAAWAARDPDAIVAMHTNDTVFHVHGGGDPNVGREAVREAIAAIFAVSPDLAFEPKRVHLGADHFVSEYVMSGSAAGNEFSVEGVDVFTVADGRIARKDTYLDLLEYQRQVGLDAVAADA